MAEPTRLEAGDKAPTIALLDQNGDKVKLSDFKGRPVLVYFYPKADTPGCTTQACGLWRKRLVIFSVRRGVEKGNNRRSMNQANSINTAASGDDRHFASRFPLGNRKCGSTHAARFQFLP